MATRAEVWAAALVGAVAWFALGLQLWLLANVWSGWLMALSRFVGYFTILTNTVVATVLTVPLLRLPGSTWFAAPGVRSATAVCIAIVAAVYALILRDLWDPQGAQAIADFLLHTLIPIGYLLFWLVFVDKRSLQWRAIPRWLIYPLAYLAVALARGLTTGWYPYPFIDVSQLGLTRVLMHATGLVGVFAAASALLIAGSRVIGSQRST